MLESSDEECPDKFPSIEKERGLRYLHSRSQRVAIEGTFSSWVPVTSGIPQSSILGPFVFLLYVNDLPDVLSNSTSIALFADDAKCSRVVRNSNDCTALQQDLHSVSIWSQDAFHPQLQQRSSCPTKLQVPLDYS
jgi:hypothetical protein